MEFSALTVDRFLEDFVTGFCSQMYFFSKLKLLGISSPFSYHLFTVCVALGLIKFSLFFCSSQCIRLGIYISWTNFTVGFIMPCYFYFLF